MKRKISLSQIMALKTTIAIIISMFVTQKTALAEIKVFDIENKKGQIIKAEILDVDKENVTIRTKGKKFTLPLNKLTEKNQADLIKFAKENNIYEKNPELKVQVLVYAKEKRQKQLRYMIDQTIRPKIKIEGYIKNRSIPDLKARMIIIGINTKAKQVDNETDLRVLGTEIINIPPVETGNVREFEFAAIETKFDRDLDISNIGGFEYKYYVLFLINPETNEIFQLETNYQKLKRYLEEFPEESKKIEALKAKSQMLKLQK